MILFIILVKLYDKTDSVIVFLHLNGVTAAQKIESFNHTGMNSVFRISQIWEKHITSKQKSNIIPIKKRR